MNISTYVTGGPLISISKIIIVISAVHVAFNDCKSSTNDEANMETPDYVGKRKLSLNCFRTAGLLLILILRQIFTSTGFIVRIKSNELIKNM